MRTLAAGFVLVVSGLGLVSACGSTSPTQPTPMPSPAPSPAPGPWDGQVRVTGTVTDFRTNKPMPSAQVAFGTVTATTDSAGAYTLSVPAGVSMNVTVDGVLASTLQLADRTYRGDLYGNATACVARYGIVIDKITRNPIAGVSVSNGNAGTTTTNSSGWYLLNGGCGDPADPRGVVTISNGVACMGLGTNATVFTHPGYEDGSLNEGHAFCRTLRADYELQPR